MREVHESIPTQTDLGNHALSNNPRPPQGWYPKPDGTRGYWDGTRWLDLAVAPLPPSPRSPLDAGGGQTRTPDSPPPVSPRFASTLPPPRPASKSKGLAITALVLGAVALGVGIVPWLGLAFALFATVIGIIAVVSRQPKGLSVTGLTLASTGLLAGAVSASIVVAGFIGSPTGPAAGNASSGSDKSYESAQVGTPVGDDEVDAEINDAVEVVDAFWRDHFSDFYPDATYQAPRVAGAYTAADPPSCGDEEFVPYNAYYCPVDNSLGWDAELMKAAHDAGDAVVYLIVAHEWGHAIQAHNNDVWAAEELQADCFAAATLYGAEVDGYFTWESGDTAEITHALTELADETAWTDTTDHGDPLDRIDAFNDGRLSGVPGCFTVED
jgi:predicted metalloprotease